MIVFPYPIPTCLLSLKPSWWCTWFLKTNFVVRDHHPPKIILKWFQSYTERIYIILYRFVWKLVLQPPMVYRHNFPVKHCHQFGGGFPRLRHTHKHTFETLGHPIPCHCSSSSSSSSSWSSTSSSSSYPTNLDFGWILGLSLHHILTQKMVKTTRRNNEGFHRHLLGFHGMRHHPKGCEGLPVQNDLPAGDDQWNETTFETTQLGDGCYSRLVG